MSGINPVLYADFPDPDVVRVGETYYMSSTTMHMFPGCQILRSYDLMHWEHCGYVYDVLGETSRQRMDGGGNTTGSEPPHIYGKGMWASSLKHDGTRFHVLFTSNDTGHSYHYMSDAAEGPWIRRPLEGFWYDPGLLFDDDGRVYVAHGNRTIRLTELTADLSSAKAGGLDRIILQDSPDIMLGWEGSHLLKYDGWYYLFNIHWRKGGMRAMGCHRARRLTDAFEGGEFMELDLDDRHAGVAQGGPVQLPDKSWAMLLFQDHGAVGRIPVVVPFQWEEGWPKVLAVPKVLELPSARPQYSYAPLYTSDPLTDGWSVLWQWNHEPHLDLVDTGEDGLHIKTDRLAGNCTECVNSLTQRCFGPACRAEVTVHPEELLVGDHAGLCALMGCFAQLAVTRTAEGFSLAYTCKDARTEAVRTDTGPSVSGAIRLAADFDFTRDIVQFSALLDGAWVAIGQSHQLVYRLDHFMGCRIGLFVHATQASGGTARFTDFTYHMKEEQA